MRNFLGATWHKTQMFPDHKKSTLLKFVKKIEGRVTKKLSREFSRMEYRVFGALSRLDDFLMNPLIQGHSGTAREPSWNALSTSQGTNEDDSQNIFILMRASSTARLHKNLAQKMTTAHEHRRICNSKSIHPVEFESVYPLFWQHFPVIFLSYTRFH